MEAYRDQYATIFNNGQHVTVIAVSVDADSSQASWARDGGYPTLFVSDMSGAVGKLYGAYDERNKVDNRSLYVIGPDGRIAYKAQPFRVMAEDAYTELDAAIDRLAPKK